MNPQEHQVRHLELHRALDELMACYFSENSEHPGAASIYNQILDLMHWSFEKALSPSPLPEDAHNSRTPTDFEAQRQMILLALAELAVSRPGFEPFIREIARRFDGERLMTFDAFKKTSGDRAAGTERTAV